MSNASIVYSASGCAGATCEGAGVGAAAGDGELRP
jgi:hypothetical protein